MGGGKGHIWEKACVVSEKHRDACVMGDKYEKEYPQKKVAKARFESRGWRQCSTMRTK